MLKELSIRNAKRQSKDYLLYFITLACTVSFMYAFNSLIFSDIVKAFPSIGVLPYMIIVTAFIRITKIVFLQRETIVYQVPDVRAIWHTQNINMILI